jgi:hypothetical protein
MRLLVITSYGTPEQLHVDSTAVGQAGDVLIADEHKGRALFARAEKLPGDGWRIEWICDDELVATISEALGSGETLGWKADGEKPRLRDRLRTRAARRRLQPLIA